MMKRVVVRTLLVLFVIAFAIGAALWVRRHPLASNVAAARETGPVPSEGDAADDPAIWIDPVDSSRSTIIGTDKKSGLVVWDLDGRELQYMELGRTNNVDVIASARLAGADVALVGTSERVVDQVILLRVDPETRLLAAFPKNSFKVGVNPGGFTFYRSPKTDRLFVFVVGEDKEDEVANAVEQWEIIEGGDAAEPFSYELRRRLRIETDAEGLLADHALGHLFVSEENEGIWRYDAEPDGGDARLAVDSLGFFGHLNHDVEGLALYETGPGTGYLIASCQVTDDFVVLEREGTHEYVGRFEIVDTDRIDGVVHTDGVCATSAALGPDFPTGVFVAQDDEDDAGRQNFKIVSWDAIEAEL